MCTYPLVNDGHPSIFEELQVLDGRLKTHHLWQQLFELLQFYKNETDDTGLWKNV